MKKSILFASVVMAVLLFGSCSSTSNMVQSPKFTSVDRLLQVQPGQSFQTVVQTLGCDPYNLLSNQADGYAIYLYKYKFTEREIKATDSEILNQRGGETAGMEVYNSKMEDVILVFKDNKLETIVSVQGRKESPVIVLFHNTLFEITKEKGKYVIIPTTMELPKEEKAGGLSIPMLGGKTKK